MPASETAAALAKASEGLTYQSETDAPWTAFAWPSATGTPTAAGVKQLGRHKPAAPAEEQSVDEFFAPLVGDQDWYGDEEKAIAAKYRSLLETVRQRLKDPKVVRVGGRKVAVYVVGSVPEGGWAGLKTTAVET
jgi:Nuclease A inhibitor-like protein